MKKNNLVYIKHIFDAICQIENYLESVSYESFMDTRMIQDAVIREIEIIGEATKKISTDITNKYFEIPWKKMARMRDKLIHHYMGVDLDAVWDTVKKDIPILKDKIKNLISDEEKS